MTFDRLSPRWSLLTLLMALAPQSPGTAHSQTPPQVVRVGAYANSPKIYFDDQGTVAGFWPDLIAHIARQENWEVRYVPGSWQDGLHHLSTGEIDLMPDVVFTEARSHLYTFSESTVLMSWSRLYVHQDNKAFHSVRDLDGWTVAALKGSANLEGPAGLREMVRGFNLSVTFLELDDYDAVFAAIEKGDAEAGISNRNFGDLNAARYKIKKTPLIFQPANLQFAFPPRAASTPYLKERIDSHIEQLKQDNESIYYQLLAHYFEAEVAEVEVEVWPSWLARTLQGAALLLVMLGIVAVASRLQVKRKTRELELRNLELNRGRQRYHEIFNAPNDAIFIHDAKTGQILDVNRAMLDMYGFSYEEALTVAFNRLNSGQKPFTQEKAQANIKAALEEGPQVFEWLARKKNNDVFWVEVSLKSTRITGKSRIIAVVRDIDRRKRALEALADERERLSVTLRSIGDAVITTDIDGRVGLLNKAAEELTGWTQAEAGNKPLPEIFHILNVESERPCPDPVQAVLQAGKIVGPAGNKLMLGRNGRRLLIADSGAPIRATSGDIIGVVLVFRDVTDQVRLEKEVLKVKKLESVGILAGGIAHDFNNILSAILGNLELSLEDVGLDHRAVPLLQEAEHAVRRAEKLTKQLLTFSRGGAPVMEAASLRQIIQDSVDFILRGSPVDGRYHFPDDLWLVHSDSGQISQVIQNLVLNARHAMPDGGTVDISCANLAAHEINPALGLAPGDFVRLAIRDQGVGIPHNILDQIFDPYFSTKQEGSGLGLAVTHSIINKHGGHVSVESEPGHGSTFTILLPAAGKDLRKPAVESDHQSGPRQGRVLVMDDEESLRNVLSKMIGQLGLEVETAPDGRKAISMFKAAVATTNPFDLVIMDLTVPGGMGGLEAAQKILDISPDARILVSSGYSNDRVMANYREYGFVGALAKPVFMASLVRVVDAALSGPAP